MNSFKVIHLPGYSLFKDPYFLIYQFYFAEHKLCFRIFSPATSEIFSDPESHGVFGDKKASFSKDLPQRPNKPSQLGAGNRPAEQSPVCD